jgi:hypothetical protein
MMLMSSCQKEIIIADNQLFHTWEAESFISVESSAYPKNEDKPILLTFKRDGTYNLKLDINSGGGTYNVSKDQMIDFGFPALTEACCDSQFSIKLAATLPKVTSYRMEGHYLYLNVPQWGDIKLRMVE